MDRPLQCVPLFPPLSLLKLVRKASMLPFTSATLLNTSLQFQDCRSGRGTGPSCC